MIIKRIKNLVLEFRTRDENQKKQNNELIWANIFHDTIKDRDWLKNLSISPGRWAADYSFLYVLVRILSDYKPKKIIEFGLGETSKIISSFLDNELKDSKYTILEQDENWIEVFKNRFDLSKKVELLHLPLYKKEVKGCIVNSYKDIEEKIDEAFDLYIIDGPFGSQNYSRYDICTITERLRKEDEFIILIDDYNRNGEKDTATELMKQLSINGCEIHNSVYSGTKDQIIIATNKYRFITSI